MMRKTLLISAAAVIAVSTSMGFEPPGPQKRLEAIGTTDGLPAVLRRALAPDDSFQPVPVPGPSDWLAVHREPGQTFEGNYSANLPPGGGGRKKVTFQIRRLG
ncbi:MAG TPA: hypothetical protein VN829_12665 [Dongiaceae bacterium]|nr:hypothetical protein [Dongiaceae bacterium]